MGKLCLWAGLLLPILSKKNWKQNLVKQYYLREIMLVTAFCFVANCGQGQVIAAWNFFNDNIVATKTASVFDPNLVSPIDLTRGVGAPASVGLQSFRTVGFGNDGISTNNSDYFQFTLVAKTGFEISLSTINANFQGTASFAGSPGVSNQFAYSLDGTNFILIGTPSIVIGQLKPLPQINLSSITALQNVPSGVTITIRYYASGQTPTGGWGFYSSSSLSNGLQIGGSVTSAMTSDKYFRSRQNGDWITTATWESSADNLNWNAASKVPTKDAETILIRSGHTVKVNSFVSLDQTTIEGILELQKGGILNINNEAGDDISILSDGVLRINSSDNYTTSVIQSAGANISIYSGGKISIGNGISTVGSGYENFATSAVNKWADGAVLEYNNNGLFAIAALTYFPNAGSDIPIFRIAKVGGSIAAGTGNDFYMNGILEVMSDITFSGAGKKYIRNGIRGNATLSQIGSGKLYLTNPTDLTATNAILDGSSLKIVLSAVMDLAAITTIPVGANVTISGANIANSGVLTIDGTLDATTININNANDLVIINGIYRTAHPGGLSGPSSSIPSTTGNVTLNAGSTIELYANGNQSLNSRTDFKNLIFSGSGTKIPNGSFNPAGTVTIKDNAVFDCSGRNIGDETDGQVTSTNLTMTDNSRLIVDSYGPNPKMGGTYNLQGGVIEFKCSNLTPETIRSKNYQNIEVSGNNVLMSQGNIYLNDRGTFTVKTGGIFTINDNTIIGSGKETETITVESGATFKCGNNKGFNGSEITSIPIQSSSIHKNITNIILEPNSTVEYSRAGDQPISNANGLRYQNFVLSGSGNKSAPADDLIVQGSFSKTSNASFIHNNGTVIFNGDGVQSYNCKSPQIIFNNLTNKNSAGLNINDSLSVYKRLLLDNNSIINLNADLSLLSDKSQTASLARIPANAVINYYNGLFIVERYINTNAIINGGHEQSWQLISTPAFGETVLNTWQEKGNKNISGYGTWITGVSNADNSFDAISPSPSMKYYDAQNNRWIGIPSTNINLENEKGYMIFIRGDRMATSINAQPNPTILRTRGKVYQVNFAPPKSTVPSQKFQSIGNPFASAIDFEKISFSDRITSYIAWDPTLYGNYGVGGYQTISETTFFKPIPGNTANYNSSADCQYIQSGQAFFVYNYSSLPVSVSFTEDCKVNDQNHLVNRSPLSERQILSANLFSKEGLIADGNAVAFDEIFSKDIDRNDAFKINKGGENFGIKRGENILVIEARENIKAADTIFYQLTNLSKQEYKFAFEPQNFQPELEAYLVDQYLNIETQINLHDTSAVTFSANSDDASRKSNRFFLILKRCAAKASAPFAVNAYAKDVNVILEWKSENTTDVKEFDVEYSTDGINFSLIKCVSADTHLNQYNFLHNQAVNGNNYYRIRRVGVDGKIEYSEVVKLVMSKLVTGINIYPNPVKDEFMNLQFINQAVGKYTFTLFNSIGQIILLKQITYPGGNAIQTIHLQDKMANGIYNLRIIKPDAEKIFLKVRK